VAENDAIFGLVIDDIALFKAVMRQSFVIHPNGGWWQSIFLHAIFESAWYTHVTTQWRQPCLPFIGVI
jgi:hypothetical protein